MCLKTRLIVGVLLFCESVVGLAAPISYSFTGSIVSAGGTLSIGTPFSGQISFELNQTANFNWQTTTGYLYQNFNFEIAGESFSFTNGGFQIDNDGSFLGDHIDFDFGNGVIGGIPFSHGRLRLVDFSNAAITSSALPFNSNLDSYNVKQLTIYGEGVDIIGNLQSLAMSPVPVPPSILFFGTGIAGLLSLGFRRKNQ